VHGQTRGADRGGRIPITFRLNARNLLENGRLQPIGAFPDGTPNTDRIIDPQQSILQATFDLQRLKNCRNLIGSSFTVCGRRCERRPIFVA
jgi:hypothetical protein